MHSFSELAKTFEERFTETLPFPAAPAALYDPCRYLVQLGGKRIRPALCLMANELFGDIREDAWHAAMAIELFHTFSLIHDDIIDVAPLRRGQPTLHTRYGLTAGILCGDVMNIYAYECLARVRQSLPQVLQLFNRTAIGVCEGQQLDVDFESRGDVTIDEYLHMITLKTSVLLACSLKLGALTGGALGDNANKLYALGENLGIAFQLQDDYLDAFGDSDKMGKQNGGDIKANKKTFLLLKALELATPQQLKLLGSLADASDADKIAATLAIFTDTGADAACRDAVAMYSRRAFDCLEDVAIPSKRKQPLRDLANYLLLRDK